MKRPLAYLATAWLAIICALLYSPSISAAESNNTIRITPALLNMQLSQGEQSTSVVINATNLTAAPMTVALSAHDFETTQTQSDMVSFYGTAYNPYTNPHGLQTVVNFSPSTLTLAPHSSQKTTITLNDLGRLAAGGHYGAILFNPEGTDAKGTSPKVSINSAVASLIFLQTATGGTQAIQLSSFSTGPFVFTLPSTTYIAFKNTGNTQVAPQGQLTLYDPRGKLVSTAALNPGSGLVLPDSSRPYTVILPAIHAHFAWLGMYRLQLQYRASLHDDFTTTSTRFFYVNPWAVISFLTFLTVCIALAYAIRPRRKQDKTPSLPPPAPKKAPRLIQG